MRHRYGLFVVLLLLSNPAAAAPNIAELVKSLDAPTLGDARSVANFRATIGHATIEVGTGTAATVLADGKPIGLFLTGSGTFTYETPNKDEFPALRYNARNTGTNLTATPEKITIQESFKSAFLWGNQLPGITGSAVAPAPAAFTEHLELFERQQFAAPKTHLFALHALNAPEAHLVCAQIHGASHPYVYLYDNFWSNTESLAVLRPPQSRINRDRTWLYTAPLSTQAIDRSNREPAPANVSLTDLDITLINTDKDDATLTVVETLVPRRRTAGALRFDLYNEYYFDINREPRHFNVRGITDEKGRSLSFSHQAGDLVVGLAEPAAVGKPIKLRFEIEGNFLYRPQGSNYWELGIEPWFPWVEMHEQGYTFHSVVKVKKPFVPFVSGKTVRREEEADSNVVETRLEQPVAWVAILAGRYQFEEETRNGVTVRVASFVVKNATAYRQLRNIAFSAIEQFPRFLGPFPFEELTILEKSTPFPYGQAPAGIVFITSEAFTPKLGDVNEWVQGVNMRFVHEIAHQYWGEAVRMQSPEDQWIDEAFAEYSAALFMKDAKRQKDYDNAFARWKADAKDATQQATIPTANRLVNPGDPLGRAMTRQGLIYAKGAYLLAGLHRELGDAMFLTFLKSFQRSFRWKFGTTSDVIGLLQFLTKKDYRPYFEQYFYGTAMPEVARK